MPRSDPYKTLGVNRKANKAAIKRAYRKAAKQSHPDMEGGDQEKFGELKRSFDLLYDDQRRARFDETGDDSEKQPDNSHSNAVNIIAFALNLVLARCAQKGDSPLEIDMITSIRHEINTVVQVSEKTIRVTKNMIATEEQLQGRFVGDKDNIFGNILEHRLIPMRSSLKVNEKMLQDHKRALDLIRDCIFKSDQKPFETPGDAMIRMLGAQLVGAHY